MIPSGAIEGYSRRAFGRPFEGGPFSFSFAPVQNSDREEKFHYPWVKIRHDGDHLFREKWAGS
jgi:hypothetical protein